MMKILQTNKISKSFSKQLVVDNVSMTIEEGDIYGFVGENGAGKTTVIRLITGLNIPTSGTFTLFEGNKVPLGSVGAIIENPSIYPQMNAYDNMKAQYMLVGRKDYDTIPQALIEVGLEDVIKSKKKAKNFSLGMKQRLGICLTLVGSPKLMILDEPMNGLDPEGIVELRNLILRLNKERNITFLISSHLLDELAKVATRFGFIHKGKLIKECTIKEIENNSKRYIEARLDSVNAIEKAFAKKILDYKIVNENTIQVFDDISVVDIVTLLSKKKYQILDIKLVSNESIEDFYLHTIRGGK